MSARNPVLILLGMLLALAACAAADVITIDGSSADWANPDTINNDPVGDVVYYVGGNPNYNYNYDIQYNYFEWDADNNNVCFAFLTNQDLPANAGSGDEITEILLNTDKNDATGGTKRGVPGLEYYLHWDFTNAPELWKYTGSWTQVASPSLSVARGVSGDPGDNLKLVEWALGADDIGWPAEFWWGAYLDNGGQWSDDYCPDDAKQYGFTPEPGTLGLVSLGLLGMIAWRRRAAKAS